MGQVSCDEPRAFPLRNTRKAPPFKMKLSTLLECIALVAAAHAATFKMPIISLAYGRSPSLSKARVAAMIEAGELRARRELSIKEQNTRRHRNSQPTGSGAIGVVENDGNYMDFIRASSTLQPLPIEPENSKRALPLWVSLKLSIIRGPPC